MVEENIRVKDLMNAVKERWLLVTILTLVITICVAFMSYFIIKPKYRASTKLFIGKETQEKNSNYSNNDVQMYQKLLKTYSDIIMTRDLIEESLNDANIDIKPEEALGKLFVTPKTDTQILQITYTSENKEEAKEVLDAVTEKFIKKSTELISNSNVNVIEKAMLPRIPVSPNVKLNIVVAILTGIFLGVGIAIMLELLDNTFKNKEQVKKFLDLPVLGSIPNSENIK